MIKKNWRFVSQMENILWHYCTHFLSRKNIIVDEKKRIKTMLLQIFTYASYENDNIM